MKKFLASLLVGIVLLIAYALSGGDLPETTQAQAAQISLGTPTLEAVWTPIPQATETPFYTPTLNYAATDAQKGLEAAQAILRAANVAATSQVEAAGIIATSQYQSDQSAQTTIKIQAFAQSTKDAAANQAAVIEVDRLEAINEADRIKQDGWKVVANIIMAVGILLIGVGFVSWLILSWRARDESEIVSSGEDVTENENDWLPAPVQINGNNSAFHHAAPVTPEIARALIDAGGLNGPLSFRGVSSRGITRATWNEIRRDLVPTFAEYDKSGAIVLNMAGCELIKTIAPPLAHNI